MEPTVTPDPTYQPNQAPQEPPSPQPPMQRLPMMPVEQGQYDANVQLLQPPSSAPSNGSAPSSTFGKWKVPLIVAGVVVVVVGGSASAYFSFYKSPGSIWKQALNNTSQGYDKLVTYSEAQAKAGYKGSKLDGTFKVKASELVADGTIQGASDGANSQGTLSIGANGVRVNAEVRAIKAAASTNPDVFVKVSGLKGLDSLLGSSAGTLNSYSSLDNQWYSIDHTLFDQFEGTTKKTTLPQLKDEDVVDAARALGTVNKKYLFSADSNTAVVTKPEKIATEKRNNRETYHYRATVDKDHLAAYLDAATKAVDQSKLGTWLKDTTGQAALKGTNFDDLKADLKKDKIEPLDVWVDTGTRTIQTIRFHDSTNPTTDYLDLGMNYTGTSKYPFVIGVHSKQGATTTNFSMTATLDTKTHGLTMDGTFDSKGTNDAQGTFSMTVVPTDDTVKVTAPTGAKSLLELMGGLGLGGTLGNTDNSAALTQSFDPQALLSQ